MLGLGSCRPLVDRAVSGSVLALEGTAERTVNGQTTRLKNGDRIAAGEKITCGPASRTDVMLLPGSLVELEQGSALEIADLRAKRDGNETTHPMRSRIADVRLLQGAMVVSIGRSQTRSRVIVHTSAGIVTAGAGRTFRLTSSGDKLRVLSVRRKTNVITAGGKHLAVAGGYLLDWPAQVTPQPASISGAGAEAETRELLEIEKKLFALEQQTHAAFIPWREAPTQAP